METNMSPLPKLLPLVHSTDGYSFEKILEEEKIDGRFCKILNNKLVFTFYGRPSYRVKDGLNNGVCAIIFDSTRISANINAVYPFDTGAYHMYIKSGVDTSGRSLPDFEMAKNLEKCNELAVYYWKSKMNYYDCIKCDESISCNDKDISSILDFYSRLVDLDESETKIDDRRHTMEISYDDHILLDAIVGVIAPKDLIKRNSDLRRLISRGNICHREYLRTFQTDTQLFHLIKNEVKELYKSEGYFN